MPKSEKKAVKKKTAAKKKTSRSAAPKKKAASGKATTKKSAAAKGKPAAKKAPAKKKAAATKKKPANKAKKPAKRSNTSVGKSGSKNGSVKISAFAKKQETKLLELRDAMLDSMIGVARDNLRSRAEGNEASAFGMHQADAGSDSYDRDFALNLLSQEQDALYEIDEALKRIGEGRYGVCEMSGKKIPQARLAAIPFARYTVECQTQIENENRNSRVRRPVGSLFGLTDTDDSSSDDDNTD